MDESERVPWLMRRAAFGGPPDAGSSVELLARLVRPEAAGVPAAPDPWDDAVLVDASDARAARVHAIDGWIERFRTTPRPLEERMAWIWHDHFATSIDKVRSPSLLVTQIRTIQRLALGSFRDLLRAMTVDGAMLRWLDGAKSTAAKPNENHGRELLELFAVGLGAHTESDVRAAAIALTGWVVDRQSGAVSFRARRHDARPQFFLGRFVSDVDSVVDAACASSACAVFVTRALVGQLLGPSMAADDQLVGDLAATFRIEDLAIRPLVERILDEGLRREESASAVIEAPVPWLVRAERSTGARLAAGARIRGLTAAGQVPMRPPNVGGWPGPSAWLSSATVLARASLAASIARATPASSPVRLAAEDGDLEGLASRLGRPQGFADATVVAAKRLTAAADVIALALAAPDAVVV